MFSVGDPKPWSVNKRYEDGEFLFESMLDDIKNAVEDAGLAANNNLKQIAKDAFGTTYVLDNDGNANLATPLIDLLANLSQDETVSGEWTFANKVLIDANDNETALTVDSEATTANAVSFVLDSLTTGHGLLIASSSVTTGSHLKLDDTSSDTGTRHVLDIIVNDASATGAVPLRLQQDSTGNILETYDAAALAFVIDDEGQPIVQATKKLFFDGGTHTSIRESSDNVLMFESGGVDAFEVRAASIECNVALGMNGNAINLETTGTKIILDTDDDTSIRASADDLVMFEVGSIDRHRFAPTNFQFLDPDVSHGFTSIAEDSSCFKISQNNATDGGGAFEGFRDNDGTAVLIQGFQQNGSSSNPAVAIRGAKRSGTSGTDLDATDVLYAVQTNGGTSLIEVLGDGQMLLPDVDPPTANYGNRNSFVKGWVGYSDGAPGSISTSYNVSSVTDDDGDGRFVVNWDTNYASSSHVDVGIASTSSGIETIVCSEISAAGTTQITTYDTVGSALQDMSFELISIGDQ